MVQPLLLFLLGTLMFPLASPFLVHAGFGWNHNRIRSSKSTSPHAPLSSAAPRLLPRNALSTKPSSPILRETLLFAAAASLGVSELRNNNLDDASDISKLSRLKDLMWCREAQEDVTAAEFACSVEAASRKKKRQRAVDYEKLLAKLNQRLADLKVTVEQPATKKDKKRDDAVGDANESEFSKRKNWLLLVSKKKKKGSESKQQKDGDGEEPLIVELAEDENFDGWLDPSQGTGRLTYTEEQRTAFLQRIIRTRNQLIQVMQGYQKSAADTTNITSSTTFLQFPELPELPTLPKEDIAAAEASMGPKLYVRDDGTVDWDGALQDQAALREFGTAVWARINGRESLAQDGAAAAPTAKIPETAAIQHSREQMETLSVQLVAMEKSHIQLLNSAISQGQATANIKLAALEPQLRSEIQESAAALDLLKLKVSFQTLVYEMERIFTYLLGELGNPASMNGYTPLQDRLNVAEFGLLESQMDSFRTQFMNNEPVDEDVLAVVYEQLTDFKRRLGIDYYVTGLSFDREAIAQWLNELLIKTKKGLAFYVKGVQLFWNDIVFCLRLVNRAAQGYTLKPREVRTIRRTFKDIITFIPFMIILIIPLTPIGHVLVFGAIQRFFPDFFPSCFTEQRQNLLQLYETAEYSELTIKETWGKKLSRLITATIYLLANSMRRAYFRIVGSKSKSNDDDDEKKQP